MKERHERKKRKKNLVTRKRPNEGKTKLKDPNTYISHNRGITDPKSKRATTELDTLKRIKESI